MCPSLDLSRFLSAASAHGILSSGVNQGLTITIKSCVLNFSFDHFSPKASSTRSPWLLGKIRGAIWRSTDHSTDHLMMKGLSENVENPEKLRFHYSVRQKIAAPGPIKLRTIFPHTSVLPKPPQLPYGAKYFFGPHFPFSNLFPIGPLMDP